MYVVFLQLSDWGNDLKIQLPRGSAVQGVENWDTVILVPLGDTKKLWAQNALLLQLTKSSQLRVAFQESGRISSVWYVCILSCSIVFTSRFLSCINMMLGFRKNNPFCFTYSFKIVFGWLLSKPNKRQESKNNGQMNLAIAQYLWTKMYKHSVLA